MVGMIDDVRRAFGVRRDRRVRVLGLELQQLGLAEGLVDDADARPQQHLTPELPRQIAAEVPIGAEDDLLVLRDLVENDLSARRRDDDVAERFHRRRAVDVGERDMVGVSGPKGGELVGRAAVLQAAAGVHVGKNHRLFGRQDFRGLGHEANAAKGDHLGVGRRRLARQIEAVADKIREVLDLWLLVIMREDHGVAFAFQALDLGEKVEPFEARCLNGHFCACAVRRRSASSIASSYGVEPVMKLGTSLPSVGKRATTFTSLNPAASSGIAKLRATASRAACRASCIGTAAVACLRRSWTARSRLAWSSCSFALVSAESTPPPPYSLTALISTSGPATSTSGSWTVSVLLDPSQLTSLFCSFDRSSSYRTSPG